MKYFSFCILLLLFFVCCKAQKKSSVEENISVKIERDHVNRISKIFLESGNKRMDSLILHDQYFSIDSLIRVDNRTWHYMYSVRCGSNCYTSNQLALSERSSKIIVQYVSLFSSGFDFDETYLKDVSPEDILQFSHGLCNYSLDSLFFQTKPVVKEYIYKGNKEDTGTGSVNYFTLKYDRTNQVYYNKKVTLKGKYSLISYNDTKDVLIDQEAFAIRFTENEYVFFSGKWYEFDQKEDKLWAVIR